MVEMAKRPPEGPGRPDPVRLAQLALAGAAISVVLSGYAAFGRPRSEARAPARGELCACDDLRREIEARSRDLAPARGIAGGVESALALKRLSDRIDALERGSSRAGGEADPKAAKPAGAPERARRFVKFEAPNQAVRVEQAADGSLRITNTDPALTGQPLIVQAHAEDGSVEPVTITIPSPEK